MMRLPRFETIKNHDTGWIYLRIRVWWIGTSFRIWKFAKANPGMNGFIASHYGFNLYKSDHKHNQRAGHHK